MNRKRCGICGRKRNIDKFNVAKGRGDGLLSECSDCKMVEQRIADLKYQGNYKKHVKRHMRTIRRIRRLQLGWTVREIARYEIENGWP